MFFFAGGATAVGLTGEAGLGRATFLAAGVEVVAAAAALLGLVSFLDSFFNGADSGAAAAGAVGAAAAAALDADSFLEVGAFFSFFGLAVRAA